MASTSEKESTFYLRPISGEGQSVILKPDHDLSFTVGTDPDSSLRLNSTEIEGNHAVFQKPLRNDNWYLKNTSYDGAVQINFSPLPRNQRRLLAESDIVGFGLNHVEYYYTKNVAIPIPPPKEFSRNTINYLEAEIAKLRVRARELQDLKEKERERVSFLGQKLLAKSQEIEELKGELQKERQTSFNANFSERNLKEERDLLKKEVTRLERLEGIRRDGQMNLENNLAKIKMKINTLTCSTCRRLFD